MLPDHTPEVFCSAGQRALSRNVCPPEPVALNVNKLNNKIETSEPWMNKLYNKIEIFSHPYPMYVSKIMVITRLSEQWMCCVRSIGVGTLEAEKIGLPALMYGSSFGTLLFGSETNFMKMIFLPTTVQPPPLPHPVATSWVYFCS